MRKICRARIPLIVEAPDVARSGATSALVESVDIYPTLCDLAGLPTPHGLDGRSFLAALQESSSDTKDAIFHVFPRKDFIGRTVRTARYRLVGWKQPGASADTAVLELYDYRDDPDETKNLAVERPEIVAELRAILAKQPEAKAQLRAAGAGKKAEARRRRAA